METYVYLGCTDSGTRILDKPIVLYHFIEKGSKSHVRVLLCEAEAGEGQCYQTRVGERIYSSLDQIAEDFARIEWVRDVDNNGVFVVPDVAKLGSKNVDELAELYVANKQVKATSKESEKVLGE